MSLHALILETYNDSDPNCHHVKCAYICTAYLFLMTRPFPPPPQALLDLPWQDTIPPLE